MGRLLIVDPSLVDPEPEGCAEVAAAWDGPSRVLRPALEPGPYGEPDALVVLGSEASVHDLHPWLCELQAWLAPRLAAGLPFLGLCFGHQLLARMMGGSVEQVAADGSKRLAIEQTQLADGRLLAPGSLRVVCSHREHVGELPPDFRATARRPGVPCDGIEHRSLPLFGFQFHAEGRQEFAGHVGLPAASITRQVTEDGRRVLEAFSARAAGR